MNAPVSRRVRALIAGTVLVSTATLSGCQVISPRQTEKMYDPADGVSVDVGDVQVRNLVVVADSDTGPGVISAAVGNPGNEDITVTFAAADGSSATAVVPAHQTLNVSVDGEPVVLKTAGAKPGAMVTVNVSTQAAGTSPVDVPVVPADGYYADLTASAN